MKIDIVPLGDLSVRMSFGETIEEKTNRRIRQFMINLEKERIQGVNEWVPAYNSITIYYEPDRISYTNLTKKLREVYNSSDHNSKVKPIVYEIPACYGGEWGPDLAFVAQYHGLSEREVIDIHANREYLIYMIGFMPGFPYLGGLADRIAVPRLARPRQSVMLGSIGIGGNQTGIYPADVPSGWRIIGVTPVTMFDLAKEEPFLLSAGNFIKFVPVDQDEFLTIKKLGDSYQVKSYAKE